MEFGLEGKLKILVEISSGRDLMVGDIVTSDPYVVVLLGEEEVHRTHYIAKT
jgi:Ca2+-dependent lipid-binding protein